MDTSRSLRLDGLVDTDVAVRSGLGRRSWPSRVQLATARGNAPPSSSASQTAPPEAAATSEYIVGASAGTWSALPPHGPALAWRPGVGGVDPAALVTRAWIMRHLRGRRLVFLGDSLARRGFFASLAWLHGCGDAYGHEFWPEGSPAEARDPPLPTPAPGSPRAAARDAACALALAGADDVRFKSDVSPRSECISAPPLFMEDVCLSYHWTNWASDFLLSGPHPSIHSGPVPDSPSLPELLREPNNTIIISYGLWHTLHTRAPTVCTGNERSGLPRIDDYDSLERETTALLSAVIAAAADAQLDPARSRVLLTPALLEEPTWNTSPCFKSVHVKAVASYLATSWRAAGLPVVDQTRFSAGEAAQGEHLVTVDGGHPRSRVVMQSVREALFLTHGSP